MFSIGPSGLSILLLQASELCWHCNLMDGEINIYPRRR